MEGSNETDTTHRIRNQIDWAIQKDPNDLYVIGDEIGSGDYGKIFECEQADSKTKKAIKIVPKKKIEDVEQFGQLLQKLTKLNHPNIIKIYDVFETEENVSIVQELCQGGELVRFVASKQIISESQSAKIMRQIFQAVLYLHEHNIIHGDLQLDNLLLKYDKDDSSIKLIDFGLYKHYKDTAIIKRLDRLKGAPFYQAPEVSKGQVTKMSDMWSLGVLLYVLKSGKSPFRGENSQAIHRNMQHGIFTFNIEPFKDSSVEVKDLISKLLIAQPKRRYTAYQSYNHPWIQFNVSTESQEKKLHEEVFKGLSDLIASKNDQKRAMLLWMVEQIPEKKKKALRKMYNKIDDDGSGSVTEEELVEGMQKYGPQAGVSMTDDQVRKIFRQMDYDGGGSVDFTEFLAAFVDNQSSKSEEFLRQQFQKMDKDGSGSVGREELLDLLRILPLGDVDVEDMVNQCDKDGDGEINFEEFMSILREQTG